MIVKKFKLIFFLLLILFSLIYLNNKNTKIIKYNLHEHIESFEQAPLIINSMEKLGIKKTVLVGSPKETIFAGEGFSEYQKNNQEILEIIEKYPEKFLFFPTVGIEENIVEKIDAYIKKGAKGIKLYNGHYASFYNLIGPLNRSELMPLYDYAERNKIPIIYHVNVGIPVILNEFEQVMEAYPKLIVNCPHFCLSSINTERFEYLMDKYPNLYTDISFGFFVEDGLERISKNPGKYRNLINKYSKRIMFATDMVVTGNKRKTNEWVHNLTKCYIEMLEKEEYYCNVNPDFSGKFNGLNLDKNVLEDIYQNSAENFLRI
jgi:predicted TIM-barrel fold metal-dependent hydrolase